MELMLELHRRGYLLAAAAGNCGRPTGQYDVALVDWQRRTLHALETTMDLRCAGGLGWRTETSSERRPSRLGGETRLRYRARHRT